MHLSKFELNPNPNQTRYWFDKRRHAFILLGIAKTSVRARRSEVTRRLLASRSASVPGLGNQHMSNNVRFRRSERFSVRFPFPVPV